MFNTFSKTQLNSQSWTVTYSKSLSHSDETKSRANIANTSMTGLY